MKYKVGDKVKIVDEIKTSIETTFGTITLDNNSYSWLNKWLGKVVTIDTAHDGYYTTLEIKGYYLNDEMIEGLVEEETKPKYEDEVNGEYYSTPKYLVRPSGYQFVDENGNVINATKIVLEKKKLKYPTTLKKCLEVIGYKGSYGVFGHQAVLLRTFQDLLICRDAYWKIAGAEMGLGKPWEPNWDDDEWPDMYYISWDGRYLEKEKGYPCCNMILIFPTEEMRDAFYENFKEEIEICKELL